MTSYENCELTMYLSSIISVLLSIVVTSESFNLTTATVKDVHDAILSGTCTCRRIIQGYVERINAYNRVGPAIGGIISTNTNALVDATNLDTYFSQNGRLIGILHCAPLIAKDNIDAVGLPTTHGVHAFRVNFLKHTLT